LPIAIATKTDAISSGVFHLFDICTSASFAFSQSRCIPYDHDWALTFGKYCGASIGLAGKLRLHPKRMNLFAASPRLGTQ
jgi:hypothetical protein